MIANLPRCGECGGHLIYRNDKRAGATGGDPPAYYRCEDRHCRKVSAVAEKLDACIVLGFCSMVRVIHDNVDHADWPLLQPSVEKVGELSLEIADLTRKITNLLALAENDDGSGLEELRARLAALREERAEKQRAHDQLCADADTKRDRLRHLADTLEATLRLDEHPDNVAWALSSWNRIDVDERRRLLGELMEGIDVWRDRLALRFSSAGVVLPLPLPTGRRGTNDKNLRAAGAASFTRNPLPRQDGVASPWSSPWRTVAARTARGHP